MRSLCITRTSEPHGHMRASNSAFFASNSASDSAPVCTSTLVIWLYPNEAFFLPNHWPVAAAPALMMIARRSVATSSDPPLPFAYASTGSSCASVLRSSFPPAPPGKLLACYVGLAFTAVCPLRVVPRAHGMHRFCGSDLLAYVWRGRRRGSRSSRRLILREPVEHRCGKGSRTIRAIGGALFKRVRAHVHKRHDLLKRTGCRRGAAQKFAIHYNPPPPNPLVRRTGQRTLLTT
jgi:hypothetical protein